MMIYCTLSIVNIVAFMKNFFYYWLNVIGIESSGADWKLSLLNAL